ncbi:MAG: rRNA maturation RNase YbeY [Planctomycetota bacterium]
MRHHFAIEILWDESVGAAPEHDSLTDAVLAKTARSAAEHLGFTGGALGIRITDDAAIREINVQHLQHDYATDVISFPYGVEDTANGKTVEGELVVSLEFARASSATAVDWLPTDELKLYIIHGVLHICGLEDKTEDERSEMRSAEAAVLRRLGLSVDRAMEGFDR